MLDVKNLSVKIDEKNIIDNVSFQVEDGDIVAILGPNGHGKSTILKSIFNHYSTKKINGEIIYNGFNITNDSPDKISKKGIFLSMQSPSEISGVKMIDLLRTIMNSHDKENFSINKLYNEVEEGLSNLNLSREFLKRDVNLNFSGGEKKKSEILQMKLINPNLLMLDEIDSGLDVDSLNSIINIINNWFDNTKSMIIVSHNEKIFNSINPNKVIVIMNGKIVKSGSYEIIEKINKEGYGWINE